jgi:hypothetical protein
MDLFKINIYIYFSSVHVAIRHKDLYVGAIHISLDGIKTWLDLILKLIEMKVDGNIIEGVKRVFYNEMEVKVSDQIPGTNLGSIIAVCVLNELGIFFVKKKILYNLLYFLKSNFFL